MAANTITHEGVRRLAELRSDNGAVLSVFFNFDPTQFPTPSARATELTSVINEASRQIDAHSSLDRTERATLKADLERVKEELKRPDAFTDGTHGLAVYACSSIDLFEVVRLPHAVTSRVVLSQRPYVEPLVELGAPVKWYVVLVNSRNARILGGDAPNLKELETVDDEVRGRHDQGGWSQANYQRSIDKDKLDHLGHVAEVLFAHFKRAPFDQLVISAPTETAQEFENRLHPYLQARLCGRISLDIGNAGIGEIRGAATEVIERQIPEIEKTAIERLAQAVHTGGKGVTGLDEVLQALNEARVDTLLLALNGHRIPGQLDPSTGFLATVNSGRSKSPEGNPLEPCDDIVETAIERAVEQSASVLIVRHHKEMMQPFDGVGALLRY